MTETSREYFALIPFTVERPLDEDDIHDLAIKFVSKTDCIEGVEIERCLILDEVMKYRRADE